MTATPTSMIAVWKSGEATVCWPFIVDGDKKQVWAAASLDCDARHECGTPYFCLSFANSREVETVSAVRLGRHSSLGVSVLAGWGWGLGCFHGESS
ncbi:hypothetical protein [Haloarcula sp. JP-L23]|uniref:hypothetical protein n=1 Tax=Haloarcula sp. JP-L23 TaxID=2716717 RepID=UPI00140F4920|nr:hypothetical protein G9465_23840 [Haloarcula sp. JP-L23]